MADTVTTQTIADTSGVKYVSKLTNFSDGTGETLIKKIDASELTFMTEDGNRKIYYYQLKTLLLVIITQLLSSLGKKSYKYRKERIYEANFRRSTKRRISCRRKER